MLITERRGFMRKRTQLQDRRLPDYTRGEEIMNMVTHIVGGGLGIGVLLLCLMKAVFAGSIPGIVGSSVYGGTMIILYTISSIYHGLTTHTSKKVMQILDHCAIYLLIAGTYTPIAVCAFLESYFWLGITLLILQWSIAALAITLNAIDLKKYKVFSMVSYIAMGWCVILVLPQFLQVIETEGFLLLLAGGISYSIGAILYGLGVKIRWMHSVFHILVVIGSILQFLSIYLYIL